MTDDEPVVVIGSGPTGAVAALRLVERHVRVTMLDAGTHAPRGMLVRAAGNTLFRYVSSAELSWDRVGGTSSDDIEWRSSLSLGGLSNYWTAAVPRFAPDDFDEGRRLDERYEWPLTYEDLVPHYEHVERLVRVTSGVAPIPGVPSNEAVYQQRPPKDWQTIVEGMNRAGHAAGMLPMAKGSPWMVARRAREFSSYHCVVEPMLTPRGEGTTFELRRGAHAVGLRWNEREERVDAVEYVDVTSGERRILPCRAVVVAAGAIDTTVLLLRSVGPAFPNGLGNNGGVVGRYLHDHPREWFVGHLDYPLTSLAHPVYIARDPAVPPQPLHATSMTIGLTNRASRLKTYYRGSSRAFGVQVFGTMAPQPTVGVKLCDDANDVVDRRPYIDIVYDDSTRANLVSARQRIVDVFAAARVRVRVPGPFHDLRPGSSVHYGGTVRMHRSPAFGALDAWNRLHEVPNVVVVDSSAFTTGPEKNPTLTAMAIADRAATRLAEDVDGH